MNGWILMLLFFGFLFGSVLLILVSGYFNLEEESRGRDDSADSPLFTAQSISGALPGTSTAAADAVVASVEVYLHRERRLAREFVTKPSLENLYRSPGRPVQADGLERYLEREHHLAEDFVLEPSVENLYRGSDRTAWLN